MKKYILLVPLFFGLNFILIGCDERSRKPVAERAPGVSVNDKIDVKPAG